MPLRLFDQISPPFPILVFEYHGFSGDGPINLFIEENLLQHRAPRPRMRGGPRSHRPKTAGPLHGSKKTSQSEPTSKTHNEFISAIGTTSVDVPPDVQTDTSVTFGPTTASQKNRTTDAAPQTTQRATSGITKLPIPLMAEPAATSLSVTAKETTKSSMNTTQPSENTKKILLAFTTRNIPTTPMETRTPEVKDQTQTIPGSTAAHSSTVAPNPATEASTTSPTSTMTITTHAAPTSAPIHPKAATSTQAATTTAEVETESTFFPSSTLPPTTQGLTTLSPDTSLPFTTPGTTSSTATTTTTRQAAQVKRKYKISWQEEERKEGHPELDEPMQRQEESTSRKQGKIRF